jgi:glycosyltransferase involved in cell wall biosynthesis
MRVLMRAGFDRYSGYGNDAIDLAVGMTKAGIDVTVWPMSILPGLPRAFTRLLEKEPVRQHDVMLTFGPPHTIDKDAGRGAPVAVGYSMWERSRITALDLPDDWTPWSEYLTAMLVTCAMNVEAFQYVDPALRVEVLPCGIADDEWPVARRDPARRMQIGVCGALAGRKDPWALLAAWKELKAEHPEFDAVLHVKDTSGAVHPRIVEAYPDVVLHQTPWSREALVAWYHEMDLLVSTSRGEGNNKPAMEFMATGGAVAATDWSGHQNWLHPGVGYPLRGQLQPVKPNHVAEDFRVDHDGLKETLLGCWGNRGDLARKGEHAATWIRQTHSWESIISRLERLLVSLT